MLGKITSIKVGLGGYQDAMFGLHVTLESHKTSISKSYCTWDPTQTPWTERCKWSEQNRDELFVSVMRQISALLYDAKSKDLSELRGKPVEFTLNAEGELATWRILTEVM
jgi:hypothetical protein